MAAFIQHCVDTICRHVCWDCRAANSLTPIPSPLPSPLDYTGLHLNDGLMSARSVGHAVGNLPTPEALADGGLQVTHFDALAFSPKGIRDGCLRPPELLTPETLAVELQLRVLFTCHSRLQEE